MCVYDRISKLSSTEEDWLAQGHTAIKQLSQYRIPFISSRRFFCQPVTAATRLWSHRSALAISNLRKMYYLWIQWRLENEIWKKEQALTVVRLLGGQAERNPLRNPVRLWNCPATMLPCTGHSLSLPRDLRFLPVTSQFGHHSALLLKDFSTVPAFSCFTPLCSKIRGRSIWLAGVIDLNSGC